MHPAGSTGFDGKHPSLSALKRSSPSQTEKLIVNLQKILETTGHNVQKSSSSSATVVNPHRFLRRRKEMLQSKTVIPGDDRAVYR
jgi:hypothetical protein